MGKTYDHLTLEERCRLRGMIEIGLAKAEMARRLGRPVAFVLRPAKRPSGEEVAGHVRRLVRRILHTAAYWLLWTARQAIPESVPLKRAEVATPQRRIVKFGARVVETATPKSNLQTQSQSRATNLLASTKRKRSTARCQSFRPTPVNNSG